MLSSFAPPSAAIRATVIIEWENVQLAEMHRCQEMLRQLRKQVHALRSAALAVDERSERTFLQRFAEPVEVLVLYDDEEVEQREVEAIIHPIIPRGDPHIDLRPLPASGNEYYDQKNFGAQQARGDFVVFLDSDVIPEDGWLETLLGTFSDPAVEIVSGNAYIDPYSTYSKAFALTWFFPLRTEDGPPFRTREFFANNLAFRRETLLKFPFPAMPPGMTRGACTALARTLEEKQVGVYRNPAARVSHPPPVGVQNFIIRALAEGRDDALCGGLIHNPKDTRLGPSFFRWARRMTKAGSALVTQRKRVGLPLAGVPVAAGVAGAYYLLYTAGNLLTRIKPELTRERFQM